MFHKDIEAVAARNFEAAGDEGDPQDDQQLLQAMVVSISKALSAILTLLIEME